MIECHVDKVHMHNSLTIYVILSLYICIIIIMVAIYFQKLS